MKILPNTSKEYPLRFFIYWLIIWAILFLYSTVTMLPKISSNGYVVRKDVCIEEGTTGRFDEYTECLEYGDPYYVPIGKELLSNFKTYGFNSFLIIFIIGWFLRSVKKTEERNTKKTFSKNLTDKGIINFLKYTAHQNNNEEYIEFYKKLDKGKSVDELFKKDKTGYGYNLVVEDVSENVYEIELGIGTDDCGSSLKWKATFQGDFVVNCDDGVVISEYCD